MDFWVSYGFASRDVSISYLNHVIAPYRVGLSNSTCSDVISDCALQFMQVYNRSVSLEENSYRVESTIAGRTLVHVSPFE